MKQRLGALDKARITAAARNLFHRERTPTALRVDAILAYYAGASFRRVADIILGGATSPESVRQWWLRLSTLFLYKRGPHGVVIVDETAFHIRGNVVYLWVAINAQTLQVIHTRLGGYQTNNDCWEFLAETRGLTECYRPIFLHDRGVWYTHQSNYLGLCHYEVRGGLRSRIECWNRQFKHRIARFWHRFPHNADRTGTELWLRTYCAIWNATRA